MAKAPKRPKASASLLVWQNFDQRMIDFEKKESHKIKDLEAKKKLMSKHR